MPSNFAILRHVATPSFRADNEYCITWVSLKCLNFQKNKISYFAVTIQRADRG